MQYVCTKENIHKEACAQMRAHTHTYTQAHARTHAYIYIYIYTHTYIYIYTQHTNKDMHVRAHAHRTTHARAHCTLHMYMRTHARNIFKAHTNTTRAHALQELGKCNARARAHTAHTNACNTYTCALLVGTTRLNHKLPSIRAYVLFLQKEKGKLAVYLVNTMEQKLPNLWHLEYPGRTFF